MANHRVTRTRWGVLIGTAVVAIGGTGVAVLGSGSSSPDTSAPSVFITAPAAAATVSGSSVTVSATCGDNVGCAGVQFKMDGANLGSEDTSAPFSIVWDSSGAGNGAHTLSAVARDAAGHSTTATSSAVTVSGAGGGAANMFVASNGVDSGTCHSAGSPCLTVNYACSQAVGGDVVGIAAGTYTAGFNISNCNPSSTVKFVNSAGTDEHFAGDWQIDGSSNITVEGDRACYGCGITLGLGSVRGTIANPTSTITFNNVNLYCQPSSPYNVIVGAGGTWCAARLQVNGNVTNFTWNGGDAGGTADFGHSGSSSLDGSQNPDINKIQPVADGSVPTNALIEHVNFHDYFNLDQNGFGDTQHHEFWLVSGGSMTFTDDTFYHCAPPAAFISGGGTDEGTSCNSASFFVGQSGSHDTPTSITMIGNVFDGVTNDPFNWSYDSPASTEFTGTFLYNTFDGPLSVCGLSIANCGPGAGSTISGTHLTFVGNIAYKQGFAGCFASATYSHNLWFRGDGTAISCSASDVEKDNIGASSIFVSPSTDNYHLKVGSGGADTGSSAQCPATDLNGTTRPQGFACDIGAVEG